MIIIVVNDVGFPINFEHMHRSSSLWWDGVLNTRHVKVSPNSFRGNPNDSDLSGHEHGVFRCFILDGGAIVVKWA